MRKYLTALTALLIVLGVIAIPASAASARTYRFFSKETSSKILDTTGKPLTDPNAVPAAGDVLITQDDDYLGTHTKHAKAIAATDHLVCTFLTIDPTSFAFTATCDAEIALPGGMLLANHETVAFGDTTIVPINGGTGRYDNVKTGKVTSVNYSEKSDNSDLTVTV